MLAVGGLFTALQSSQISCNMIWRHAQGHDIIQATAAGWNWVLNPEEAARRTAQPRSTVEEEKKSHNFIMRQVVRPTETKTLISCGIHSPCQREACAHRRAFVICILMSKYVGRCLDSSVLIR